MITEDYVSFETAKLLKERGFDEPCKVWYTEYISVWGGDSSGDRKYINIQFDDKNRFNESYKFLCYAPTLQMARKWLRKNYNIHIEAIPYVTMEGFYWAYKIVGGVICRNDIPLPNYCIRVLNQKSGFGECENACEAAIKYCLENLI